MLYFCLCFIGEYYPILPSEDPASDAFLADMIYMLYSLSLY
jgi:hypothetical protein